MLRIIQILKRKTDLKNVIKGELLARYLKMK